MKPRLDDVRSVAAWIIDRVLATGRSSESLFLQCESDFALRDRALLRELTLGTLRWLRRLDAVISVASRRSLRQIDRPLRTPLRLAAYQLL